MPEKNHQSGTDVEKQDNQHSTNGTPAVISQIDTDDWATISAPAKHTENNESASTDYTSDPECNKSDDEDDNEEHQQGVLQRVLTLVTSKSSVDIGPPPDGGTRAWLQCLAAHLVIFNTWGWANSFGSFQTYYTSILDRSPSEISWIGSLNVFLLFFIGAFTGRLCDAGYFRVLFITGAILWTLGIFMTSLCTQYWHFILAQGITIGMGNGFIFCPTLAVVSSYFDRKRAIVLGLSACGSATGGLVFPAMVRQLLPKVGFAWTVRAIAFVQLAITVIAYFLIKPRLRPRKTGPLIELSAFKELEYTFYAAAGFFNFWGVYFTFFYLPAISRDDLNPPLPYSDSLNLLLILNGVGIIGRILPNYIADRVGAVNVFIPTSAVSSILMFCFIPIKSPGGLYGWSIIYGIFAAGIQSLFPAALSFLTTDLRKLGVRMGMIFTIVSFAVLTGPPVAGAIVSSRAGYAGAKAFSGASIAVGCGFLIAAKIARMRKTGQGWRGRI